MIRHLAQEIYRQAVWIVLPILLLLVFPSPWMSIGFAASLAVFLLRWIGYGSPVPPTRANPPLLILLAMVAIGFVISSAPDLAVITVGQIVAGVTVFFVLLDQMHSLDDVWRVAGALVVLGLVFTFVAPFTVQWGGGKLFGLPEFYDRIWPRLPKVTNPNILAGAIAPIVPITFAFLVRGDRRWRTLGALSLAPLVIILLLLQSRGALFALGAGVAVWATSYRRWVFPLIALGLVSVLLANGVAGGPSVTTLLYGEIRPASSNTFVQRQDLWVQAFSLIRQSPFFGIGLGAFPRIAPTAWPYEPAHPGWIANHAHNLFLQIALDTGVLGLAAFAVILFYAFRSAWNAYGQKTDRHVAIGIMAGLTVVCVHGLGDVIVWGTSKSSVVLWILLSLAIGLDKVRKVV